MGKIINVDKKISREQLNEVLAKFEKRKKIDLNKYVGKVNFGADGLEYQLKMRAEWK